MQMAEFKATLFGGGPIVTVFECDLEALYNSPLRIKHSDHYSEDWADFVLFNRENEAAEQYDFVYGPIANDKVGLQIRKLKDGSIDKAEFLHRLKYMHGITFQYFFGTDTAIKFLKKHDTK